MSPVWWGIFFPSFFWRRVRILCLEVSDMNVARTRTGAAMMRTTHWDHRQFWWYSSMIYAPAMGPRAGPRKGASMKPIAALPFAWGDQESATVPAPTAKAPDPTIPAIRRLIISWVMLFEAPEMAVKTMRRGRDDQ